MVLQNLILSITGSEIPYYGLELCFSKPSYVVVPAQRVLFPSIFLKDSFKHFCHEMAYHDDNYLLPNRSVVRAATHETGHLVLGSLQLEVQQNHVLSTRLVSY